MALTGWPRQLDWKDFKKLASRPRGATVSAHIESQWYNPPRKPFRFVRDRHGWHLDAVNIVVSIDPNRTWVVRGEELPALLNHEQGHWDITGLIAREAHLSLEHLRTRTHRELTQHVQRLQSRLQAKASRINLQYDAATNHGVNLASQQKWDSVISKCMADNKPLPNL